MTTLPSAPPTPVTHGMADFPVRQNRIIRKGSPITEESVYTVEGSLSQGSFGDVYVVKRIADRRLFAAKLIDPRRLRPDQRPSMIREIKCMAQVDHFAVVKMEEAYIDAPTGVWVIVLEFMDAGDLKRQSAGRKQSRAFFGEYELRYMFVQLLVGLQHIHSKRILHRDIKSGNAMVSASGLVKFGDFGLSNLYPSAEAALDTDAWNQDNAAKTVLGTPHYVPPEMWTKQRYGRPADIWSLGVLMYELAELRFPFPATTLDELIQQVLHDPPAEMHACPEDLRRLILWMLQKDPPSRPTCEQLLATPEMSQILQNFREVISRNTRLPAELRTRIDAELVHASQSRESSTVRREVQFEGPISEWTDAQHHVGRYLVVGNGVFEILESPSAPRGHAARDIASLLVVRLSTEMEHGFVLSLNDGTDHVLSAENAEEWVTQIKCAMGIVA